MPSLINKNFLLVACLFLLVTFSCSKKTGSFTPRTVYNVNIINNIVFGANQNWQGNNQTLRLNLFSPKNASAANEYPLLLMAHGGSFVVGEKESLAAFCSAFAEKGFVVASIDYRMGWDTGSAACGGDTASLNEAVYRAMQDYNASLRFLVANAGKYFIDTNWIFTGGASAGAIVALNSAYIPEDYADNQYKKLRTKLGGLRTADNNLTNTYTIKGMCSMWGAVFSPDIITAANGIPTIAYHGSEDITIPVNEGNFAQCPNYEKLYGSAFICNRLSSFNIPAVAHIYEGEGHGPLEYSDDPEFVPATTFCFFQSLMHGAPQKGFYKNMQSNCQ